MVLNPLPYLMMVLSLTALCFNFISCSGSEDDDSNFVAINVPTPLVILVDRELVISDEETVSLSAPWAIVNFTTINNSTRIITIVGGAYIVTDPLSGERKVLALESSEGDTPYEGVIFPSRDTNCDGFVDEAEAKANVAPSEPCRQLVTTNPTDESEIRLNVHILDDRSFFLSDIGSLGSGASGTEFGDSVASLYRGLEFSIAANIEGWIGTPNQPERNFFKEFFFTARAN